MGSNTPFNWHVLISGRVPGRSSHLLKVSATSQEGLVDDQVFSPMSLWGSSISKIYDMLTWVQGLGATRCMCLIQEY